MTMFRCAEDQSRTGIHNTLEFLQVMVGNAVEETVAIVLPTGYKCMNQIVSGSDQACNIYIDRLASLTAELP